MSRFLFSITFLFQISMLVAQTFVEIGNTYPVSVDGNKYVVNGFITFDKLTDEEIYANTLLWTVENVCPKLQEGINDRNDKGKSFRCDWIIGSLAGSGFENTYYCRVNFRVADQKLVYYISDVLIESPAFVMKKVTPLEKLTPDKKAAHKQTIEDFTQSEICITLSRLALSERSKTVSHASSRLLSGGHCCQGCCRKKYCQFFHLHLLFPPCFMTPYRLNQGRGICSLYLTNPKRQSTRA